MARGCQTSRYINQVHVAAIISNTLWPALLTTSVAAEDRTKVVSNTIVKKAFVTLHALMKSDDLRNVDPLTCYFLAPAKCLF